MSDPQASIEAAMNETLRGHTFHWWRYRRSAWGGLSALELMEMGCYATVAYAAKEVIDRRNLELHEAHALWFNPDII